MALGELVRSRLVAIGSAALVGALFSWPVAALLLATAGLVEWWSVRMSVAEHADWRSGTQSAREADYAYELGMGTAAKEIRVFGFASWLNERHLRDWWSGMRPLWRARRTAMWRTMVVYAVHLSALAVGVWALARDFDTNQHNLSAIAAALTALLRLAGSSNGIGAAAVERGNSALHALYGLPDFARTARADNNNNRLPLTSVVEQGTTDPPRRPAAAAPEVQFEGVYFRYPNTDSDVLRDLHLRIGPGEAIGLVGLNGAGKSTLVHLLAGALRPTAGRVLVDGLDLAEMNDDNRAAWQRRIAPITQNFLRLPLSAEENVVFDGPVSNEQKASVAAVARIDTAIEDLPLGWDTVLDRSVTDGRELSGGEWQRLALARSLYAVRGGAGLLLLDEPASALDVKSEAELVDRYLQLATGVTSLLISHRFSVVRRADRICLLDAGAIREQGSHEELMASGGHYARLFHLQASHYLKGDDDA